MMMMMSLHKMNAPIGGGVAVFCRCGIFLQIINGETSCLIKKNGRMAREGTAASDKF